jgi:hypothetical protein
MQGIKSFVQESAHILASNTELRCLNGELVCKRTQATKFFRFKKTLAGCGRFPNERSPARHGSNHAVPFQVLKGTRYGIRVDAKLGSSTARGRELIARLEKSRGNTLFNLLLQL